MRTFKQFLAEATLNFDTTDISPASKQKGRTQIATAIELSGEELSKVSDYFTKATPSNIMVKYNKFLTDFPVVAKAIDKIKPEGVGPGEFILYFLFDNIGIGGKNAPIDVYMDGKEWAEAKGGDPVGSNTLTNFKITKDSSKAVTQLMSDLEAFNTSYSEITGDDLEGWRGANELTTNTLRKWASINLSKLAKESTGGSKKPINLVLKKDGDLLRKGDEDPVMNVNKAKSVAPIKKLISGEGAEVAVDKSIDTLDKIVKKWAETAYNDYASGKRFLLFVGSKGSRLPMMKYNGHLSKDMIGLYMTHRNQPWAEVYLEPGSKEKAEATK